MNTVVFLSSSGKIQQLAYEILERMWNDHQIVCLYKHTSKKQYKRFPETYDLGISFLYDHEIPIEEINKTRWVKFHTGPLPEYNGYNCPYFAIINGAKEYGASIHDVYPDKNAGIIDISRFPIQRENTSKDLIRKSQEHAFLLFIKYIPLIISNQVGVVSPQPTTYYHKIQINNEIYIGEDSKKMIRALTTNICPKIRIADSTYTIIRD